MTREQYIKDLIKQNGYTIKEFAQSIDMPYSTLLSIVNQSIGGTAIDNVLRICKGLNITLNDLQHVVLAFEEDETGPLTAKEKRLVRSYRAKPEMQKAVDLLLEIGIQ
jgi:repressor LexA